MATMDMLILGKGWVANYLLDYCQDISLNVAATTTTGRDNSIPFSFTKSSTIEDFLVLPVARTVVITFPIVEPELCTLLIQTYKLAKKVAPNFILYGSTRPWHGKSSEDPWANRNGPVKPDARYESEEWMLQLGQCVLNLAGLYGGPRRLFILFTELMLLG
jgi:hypothetical protein